MATLLQVSALLGRDLYAETRGTVLTKERKKAWESLAGALADESGDGRGPFKPRLVQLGPKSQAAFDALVATK